MHMSSLKTTQDRPLVRGLLEVKTKTFQTQPVNRNLKTEPRTWGNGPDILTRKSAQHTAQVEKENWVQLAEVPTAQWYNLFLEQTLSSNLQPN